MKIFPANSEGYSWEIHKHTERLVPYFTQNIDKMFSIFVEFWNFWMLDELWFSGNSEELASEFLDNLEQMLLHHWIYPLGR